MQIDELIRTAFPADDPPAADTLVSDACSFCVALRSVLQGKRWTALGGTSLEQHVGSIAQLTPSAFVYYLPAFLLQAVEAPWKSGVGSSAALFFTVSSICDPDLPEDEWWRERVPLLTDAQRHAVAAFLQWAVDTLAEVDDEASLKDAAQLGLQNYWGRYLVEEPRRRPTRS